MTRNSTSHKNLGKSRRDTRSASGLSPVQLLLVFCVVTFGVCIGCNRDAYRKLADRDAYRLLKSRQFDSRWELPTRTVEPDPRSRLADVHDPDCGPLPPDDPAAKSYMRKPFNSRKQVTYWDEIGEASSIDSERWMEFLPYNESGEVVLDKQLTVDLALLHSREFQTRVEQLHTQALSLSANRFEFMLNWFGGTGTSFAASDDGSDANRELSQSNRLGFNRTLATGGQFAANLANTFSWNLGGNGNSNFSAGNLAFTLSQPLLRGAFRHVRTESLTQSERSLLYQVRDFARFRRQFYLDTVSQYLNLLLQAQSFRIEEENIANLALRLEEHEELFRLQKVSPIQVDQVFQSYQSGRIALINTEQALQTAMDSFKFQLGLPAKIQIKLDEDILSSFEVNSPELVKLQEDAEALEQSMMKYIPPNELAPEQFLNEVESNTKKYAEALAKLKPMVDDELTQWLEQLENDQPSAGASEIAITDFEQQEKLALRIKTAMGALEEQITGKQPKSDTTDSGADGEDTNPDDNISPVPGIDEDQPAAAKRWRVLQHEIARFGGLKDRIATLFVYQTQIRLFLIEIKPLEIEEQTAVEIAMENRLDLMNSRAAVVDAFRSVEIAADNLESDLTVNASADLRSDPSKDNAFRLDGDENQYRIGVEFDGPLNRLGERNAYRSAQLAYQQQRRAYMADEDRIVNSVRSNIRQLRTNRFSFQIARQRLIAATRQVEQAQLNLKEGREGDSSPTQDLLQALELLKDNKNSLISSWIQYETSRISLFVDLEYLKLDDNGIWTNDQASFDNVNENRSSDSQSPVGESNANERLREPIDQPVPPQPELESGTQPQTPTLDGPAANADSARRPRRGHLLGSR